MLSTSSGHSFTPSARATVEKRSLKGLIIHQENKLEKLQSSKYIIWHRTPTTAPCQDKLTYPIRGMSPEIALDSSAVEEESWHWHSALNNPSPDVITTPEDNYDHEDYEIQEQVIITAKNHNQEKKISNRATTPIYEENKSIYTHSPTATATLCASDMEPSWNIIDYLLGGDQPCSDPFPADEFAQILTNVDQGEIHMGRSYNWG